METIFRSIGKYVVHTTLFGIAVAPILAILVTLGINPFTAVLISIINLFAAGIYWALEQKLEEVK